MQTPDRQKAIFVPYRPSVEVQKFLKEHPQENWAESLTFLLDHYPQRLEGRVQYLIEGGVAVRLLHPQRREPADVDVLVRSDQLKRDFRGSHRLDVKNLTIWFGDYICPFDWRIFDPKQGEFLFDEGYYEEVDFNGRPALVMSTLVLAASKSILYRGRSPRQQDLEDLRLLSQDPNKVMTVITRIQSAYTHPAA